jgi:hypothetical protein
MSVNSDAVQPRDDRGEHLALAAQLRRFRRCECGRLFTPDVRMGTNYGELHAVDPDPERCRQCQEPRP